MRSVVVTAPGKMEPQERPIPEPAPGWVVVRVQAMGVCGTDLEILEGTLPYLRSGKISYPIVPGHEWSGEVVSVGVGANRFTPGDRVSGETHVGCGSCERCRTGRYSSCEAVKRVGIGDLPGGCAEYITVPAQSVHRLPDSMDFATAAVLEPTTVALYGLSRAGLMGGEHVVVVDAAGDPDFFGQEVSFLRKGGTLAAIGLFKRPVPKLDLTPIVTRNLSVVGSLGSPGIWDRAIALVGAGRLEPSPIITHRFSLKEAERAFHTAADHETGAIKVIIQP